MRIALITAGAGGMYCGQCLQGNTLAAALRDAGEDVFLVPAYTPLRTDEDDLSLEHVVLGGLNVYLHQRVGVCRWMPPIFMRWLDSPRLLRWIGERAAATAPAKLGPLTVAMLRGDQGPQRSVVQTAVRWLKENVQPEVVHLSTALLAGLGSAIRRQLHVPVVAGLAGEDLFVSQLPEPYSAQARQQLCQHAAELDGLVAPSRHYAGRMAEYLNLPPERITVVPPGLNLAGHLPPGSALPYPRQPSERRRIGYLGRIAPEKGVHLLVEALDILRDRFGDQVELVAAGYLGPAERTYLANIERWLAERRLTHQYRYLGAADRRQKIAFLQSLDVLCLPSIQPEARGLPALEAWANGVPVVAADQGAFPELLAQTGGGLLFRAHDVVDLARNVARLLENPALAAAYARQAQEVVHRQYHAASMAEQIRTLYRRIACTTAMSNP